MINIRFEQYPNEDRPVPLIKIKLHLGGPGDDRLWEARISHFKHVRTLPGAWARVEPSAGEIADQIVASVKQMIRFLSLHSGHHALELAKFVGLDEIPKL